MITEPLDLHHRELLQPLLRAAQAGLSEYSFANLYLFRAKHDYRVIPGEPVFLCGKSYAGLPYAMPTDDVRRLDLKLLDRAIEEHGALFPIPGHWLSAFPADRYEISSDEAESDYIHSIAKLTAYSGSRLHAKKNLLNRFLESHTVRTLPLTHDRLADALDVLDRWMDDSGLEPGRTDYGPCREALALYELLALCGSICYVDSAPAGFVIGEELDAQTFVLHFTKGDRAIKGIYQYLYQQFASIMPARYALFNVEQDLGIDSLRRAKASYHPDRMGIKYRVGRREK